MTRTEAKADVFLMALKSLPKEERDAVLERIALDRSLARHLLDLITIEERRSEPSRSFREYIAASKGAL